MFVPNFKILSQVVSEKSLTEKSKQTHTHKQKRQKLYTPYILRMPAYKNKNLIILSQVVAMKSSTEDVHMHYIGVRDGKIENLKKKEK